MKEKSLIDEMTEAPARQPPPKVRYTHTDMIDFIIANPHISQNEIGARYGYSAAWVSRIVTSDAFQSAMAARREEIVDPDLRATAKERFEALVHLSLQRLMKKLEQPQVSDAVVLKALELGGKFIGAGVPAPAQPNEPEGARLERLAHRLIDLQQQIAPLPQEPIRALEIIPQAS